MTTTINASSSSGLITTADTSTVLQLQTNGTAALTIDASANVGIGTASPASKLHIYNAGDVTTTIGSNTGASIVSLISNSNGSGAYNAILSTTTSGENWYLGGLGNSNTLAIRTAGTERMRIDSSGRVYSGSSTPWTVGSGGVNAFALYGGGDFPFSAASQSTITGIFNRCTSTGTIVEFKYNAGVNGSVSTNGTNVAYNTSSDYRLKEDIAPMTSALSKVAQLKPVTYKWKINGSDGEGFIAHELAEVCPQAVHGTKDEVDADGNPVYQGIDTSFLVATLTAAIQELKAINDTQAETINALTARIVALEGA